MRPRRATQGTPNMRSGVPQASVAPPAPSTAIQCSHQQARGRAPPPSTSACQQVAPTLSSCRGVVRQSSAPVTRAALANTPLRSSPGWSGAGKFGAASLRASPQCPIPPTVSSPSSSQQAELAPKLCDGASSPRMGGSLMQPGSPLGTGLRNGLTAAPKPSLACPSQLSRRAGSTTPSCNQAPRTAANNQGVVAPVRSSATSPRGGTRSPAPPARTLPSTGATARAASPNPLLSWRAPSPPGSPSTSGAMGGNRSWQATSSYQPSPLTTEPVLRSTGHRFAVSPSGDVQIGSHELAECVGDEVCQQPSAVVHPSAGSRSPSPKGNVSWRVMPPAGCVLSTSLEGVTTAPVGPLLRQMVRPSLRVSRGSPQTMPSTVGFQASSPSASPVQSMRNAKPPPSVFLQPTTAVTATSSFTPPHSKVTAEGRWRPPRCDDSPDSTWAVAEMRNAQLPPSIFFQQTAAVTDTTSERRWRPPWCDDSSDSAWTAAEELEAAATNMGLLDGDIAEHKWFFEGLQKGFAKKARKEEQEAFAEVLASKAAAEAALGRCREELRLGAEQRAALEEVLTASQASREEMTQMVAQVAEVKQRMTEEMAQQALDMGMELRLCARDALSGSLGSRLRPGSQEGLVDAPLDCELAYDAEDSVCLLARPWPDEEDGGEEAFVTFRDVQLPLYTEDRLQSFPIERLHRHALHLRATLGDLLENPMIPEASLDIADWIANVQREHLEILPELDKLIRSCELQFDTQHDSECNDNSAIASSPPSLGLARQQHSTNHKVLSSSICSVAATVSSPSTDRHDLSRANRSSSMASTPESKKRPTSPTVSASSPVLIHRSPAPSVLLSGTRTSPATSMRSGMSPCGSARKLSDNAIRTLPAPLANLARDTNVSLRLADRLGTGSPPVGPVRLNSSSLPGVAHSRKD